MAYPGQHFLTRGTKKILSKKKLDHLQNSKRMLTTQAKLKEESDILHNIRKREMIDKINKGTGVEKREKEEKKKIHEQSGTASGSLNTRNLLVAPITNGINQSDKVCILG